MSLVLSRIQKWFAYMGIPYNQSVFEEFSSKEKKHIERTVDRIFFLFKKLNSNKILDHQISYTVEELRALEFLLIEIGVLPEDFSIKIK